MLGHVFKGKGKAIFAEVNQPKEESIVHVDVVAQLAVVSSRGGRAVDDVLDFVVLGCKSLGLSLLCGRASSTS